jgi:starch phosphorylase
MTAQEVMDLRGHYHPEAYIQGDERLQRVLNLLESGHFNQFEQGLFDEVLQSIRSPLDPWMVAADFSSYVDAQNQVTERYQQQSQWIRSSIYNTAFSGRFSTDRTMKEYNRDIWHLDQVPPVSP